MPGTGAFQLSADALAGAGDVAALLGNQEVRRPVAIVSALRGTRRGAPRVSCRRLKLRDGSHWRSWTTF